MNPVSRKILLSQLLGNRLEVVFPLHNLLREIVQAAFEFSGYKLGACLNVGYGREGMKDGNLNPIDVGKGAADKVDRLLIPAGKIIGKQYFLYGHFVPPL